VVNLLYALQDKYSFSFSDSYLFKTTYIFDVSVTEIFGWFLGGGRMVLLELDGEKNPQAIIEAVENSSVTHINFVPSMFKIILDTLNHQNISVLKSLKYIFLAGEPLQPELASRFMQFGTGISLENLYGPTEGTVYASGYSLSKWNREGPIPIGVPLPNLKLDILDKYGHPQPVGIPGELCISGAGTAEGYLNRPELTAEKFIKYRSYESYKTYTNYKTGDLARWLDDCNIEFLGRIDLQVKIRGFRIELGEIENQLLTHEKIKEAILIAREDWSGDKYLCAYIVAQTKDTTPPASSELKEYLAQRLPGYMIPSYFVQLDRIPLTPNGKVDKRALPKPQFNSNLTAYTPPANDIEMKLAEIWSEVLGIEKEKISVHDNFFESGGQSLKVVALTAKIFKIFNVKVPLPEAFKNKTIRTLSEYIMQSGKSKYLAIEPLEKREYYDVSFGQKRVWLLSQSREASLTFNMFSSYLLDEEVNIGALNKAFESLLQRHENLRTVFLATAEEVYQTILDPGEINFQVDYQDIRTVVDKENHIRSLMEVEEDTPFDLRNGPLLRVKLLQIEEKKYLLLSTMHHIISDFLSMEVLQKEFSQLYQAFKKDQPNPLTPLKFQYKEFASWQNKQLQGHFLQKLQEYWGNQFKEKTPLLQLPYDKNRPRVQSFNGETGEFSLSRDHTVKLRAIANENDVTLFMTLLASVNIFLSFYSGQNDIIIGTPASGREHPDLENQIGFYLNTLALRTKFREEDTFTQLLQTVKTVTLGAFEHQMFPFDKLIDDFKIKREPGRHPLFDVMIDMIHLVQDSNSQEESEPVENNEEPKFLENAKPRAKFDLVIYFSEGLKNIHVAFEYNSDLFERKTITRMAKRYRKLLEDIIKDPQTSISKLLLHEEQIQLPSFSSFLNT
jgi:non-ribosomal peptide synthetase component F/acyl carrier protein